MWFFFISTADADGVVEIDILGMFQYDENYNDSEYTPGPMMEASVRLALEEIDSTDDLLDGYRLNLHPVHAGCSAGESAFALAEYALRPNKPVVVLGPECEAQADLLGGMVNPDNTVITVSHKARTTSLDDATKYRHFFRTVAPYIELNKALYGLLVKFNWERICILIQGENTYIQLVEHFTLYLQLKAPSSYTIIHSVTWQNPEFLLDSYCRVFVIFAQSWAHPFVSCEMHRHFLTGEYFQTIFIGNVLENETLLSTIEDCPINLNESARSAISIHFRDTRFTDSFDSTGSDFIKELEDSLGYNETKYWVDYEIAAAAYDATWAIAMGLNASIGPLAEENLTLENYLPQSAAHVSEVIIEQFEKIYFQGVYKTINFTTEQHFPDESIIISQFQEYRFVPILTFNTTTNEIEEHENVSFVWIGNGPPSDRPAVIVYDYTRQSLYLSSISIFGLAVCLVFFIFNCYFRNEKVIKASSPHINNIILLGCAIIFVSISFFAVHSSPTIPVSAQSFMCNVPIWLIFSGFTLSFGSLTVKTWRIYRVFQNPWSRQRIYKDSSLALIIAGLLVIDIIVLTLMTAIAPYYYYELSFDTVESTEVYYSCAENQYSQIFISTLIIYKVIVIAVAGFLALQTRKIKSKAFNDSKWIAVTIYLIILTLFFGIPISIISLLTFRLLMTYITILLLLFFQGSIPLLTLFVPKFFDLWKAKRKPSENNIVVTTTEQARTVRTYERRTSDYYRAKPKSMRTIDSSTVLTECPEDIDSE